jgi:hypothetical protein
MGGGGKPTKEKPEAEKRGWDSGGIGAKFRLLCTGLKECKYD